MQKILFTNSVDVTFESDKINKMFQLGLDILHIRKSKYSLEKTRDFIRKIDKIHHSKIVIQEYFELLDEFNLKGIHINRENRKSFWFNFFTLKRIGAKHKNISISYTAETVMQVKRLAKKQVSYILLSRVFSANTTNRLSINFDKEELIKLNSQTTVPIVALGGIDEITAHKSMQIGFSGIAMQSFIWSTQSAVSNFNRIIDIIDGRDLVQISKHA